MIWLIMMLPGKWPGCLYTEDAPRVETGMFQKYTEKARKAIFFARYEASQFGSEHIGTEHLLLGIFREDRALALRLLKVPEKLHSIRENIEKELPRREKISTSVDLP